MKEEESRQLSSHRQKALYSCLTHVNPCKTSLSLSLPFFSLSSSLEASVVSAGENERNVRPHKKPSKLSLHRDAPPSVVDTLSGANLL